MQSSDLYALQQRVAENLRSRDIAYTSQDASAAQTYSPFHQAAAVLSTYDSETLNPVEPGDKESSIEDVLIDSVTVKDEARHTRWMLQREIRQDVLRQMKTRDAMLHALAANPIRPSDSTQKMLEAYLEENAPPLEMQDASQVAGTFQVSDWLAGILDGVPSLAQVRERYEIFSLLQPFESIAGKHFRGREKELQRLRDYVGVLPPGSWFGFVTRVQRKFLIGRQNPH